MKDERDIFDDLVRSKLQNFEADTTPDDWEAIANRISERKVIPFRKRFPYWAAAAVALLLMISGGIYLSQYDNVVTPVAKHSENEKQTEPLKDSILPITSDNSIISESNLPPVLIAKAEEAPATYKAKTVDKRENDELYSRNINEDAVITKELAGKEEKLVFEKVFLPQEFPLIDDINTRNDRAKEKTKKPSSRKWSFGTGIGGITESSGNVVNTYVLRSNSYTEDEKLLSMNALTDEGKSPKTNIKHKTPISFGISVSRHLNDRFSLQTGLMYSLHRSSWETEASVYNKEINRRLHFIGIPLSLNYKIAEWNKLQVYASAGLQTEINVAGQERTKDLFKEQATDKDIPTQAVTKNVRMKEWQWSVNARAGVSYPIIRFISAYAEVGAAYYFDNGSKTETIYSDKPFNVSPQIGLRLNF